MVTSPSDVQTSTHPGNTTVGVQTVSDDGNQAGVPGMTSFGGIAISLATGSCLLCFLAVSFALYHRRLNRKRKRDCEYNEFLKEVRPDLIEKDGTFNRARCHVTIPNAATPSYDVIGIHLEGIENKAFESSDDEPYVMKSCPYCLRYLPDETRPLIPTVKRKSKTKKRLPTNSTDIHNLPKSSPCKRLDEDTIHSFRASDKVQNKRSVGNDDVLDQGIPQRSINRQNKVATPYHQTEMVDATQFSGPSSPLDHVRNQRSKCSEREDIYNDGVILKADVHRNRRMSEIEKTVNFDTDYFYRSPSFAEENSYYDDFGSVPPSRKQGPNGNTFARPEAWGTEEIQLGQITSSDNDALDSCIYPTVTYM